MPTKNTKSAAKPAAKTVAATTETASCGCGCCCCQRSGFWHWVKKLIIVLVIFAVGVIAGKILCFHHMGMMRGGGWGMGMGWRGGDMFVNGCLDMSKISCPMMAQKVAAADANGDGCITRDEMRAWKQSMRAAATSDEECDDE